MQPFLQSLNLVSASAAAALLSAVWQGALLALATALCLRLLPRLAAALRSLLWTAVLLIATALHLRPLLSSTSAVAISAAGSTPGLHSTRGLHIDSRWALALVAAWAVLSLLRLVALARSATRLHHIALRSSPVTAAPAILPLLRRGKRQIELCTSNEVDRPCVLGLLSPRILLPPELLATLQTPELTHIVLHEMEHLRRNDHWLNLFQKLVLALSPLNPVLLWVERRLCLERELACDDGVLRFTRARKVYATCLTNLAEHAMVRRSLSLALGAWEKHSELTRRVQRILSLPELVLSRPRAALLSATLLAALTGASAVLARTPQLVTFSTVASTIAPTPPTSKATLNPPQLQSVQNLHASYVQASMKLTRPVGIPVTKHRARATILRTRLRPSPIRTGPRVALTTYRPSRAASPFVFTNVSDPNISYAAVPWLNGWLLVQL